MNYNHRYRLIPTESQRETLDYHRDTCRQLYNHALYRFNQIPEGEGMVKRPCLIARQHRIKSLE